MELVIGYGIGDQLALSATIRAFKLACPDENVRIFEAPRPELWANNPRIGCGNHENGKRVNLKDWSIMQRTFRERYANVYSDVIRKATGAAFRVADERPELFLTADEWAVSHLVPVPFVAIDVWATAESRRWSYGNYIELADTLLKLGLVVVEVGGGRDRGICEKRHPLPCSTSFFGRLSIRETAALLSRATAFIGNDSGLMHVAAAVGTKQIIWYGDVKAENRVYSDTTPFRSVKDVLVNLGIAG